MQKDRSVPGFWQVAFWKFLLTLLAEQNSSPMKPVKPQSESERQLSGVFLHSLIIVPGFRHSSIVLGLLSLQSEFVEQIIS